MSELLSSSPPKPELTKIEKLEAQLGSSSSSKKPIWQEAEKEEKLRQKLQYLQFFASYSVDPAPTSFSCSCCRKVQVQGQEVAYKECQDLDSKEVSSHPDGWHRRTRRSKEKVTELRCQDKEQHQKEWQEQEKGRQEVRQEIRRQFAKEELRGRRKERPEGVKETVAFSQGDFTLETSKPRRTPAPAPAQSPAPAPAPASTLQEKSPVEFEHGAACRTCSKMAALTGQILPHPVNY